jgi:exo-beta-1,3-glucanase (GH17 family)
MDLSVHLGVWNLANDNHATYMYQRQAIVDAIKTHGTDHILGVTVGNEFMLAFASFGVRMAMLMPLNKVM